MAQAHREKGSEVQDHFHLQSRFKSQPGIHAREVTLSQKANTIQYTGKWKKSNMISKLTYCNK